MQFLKFCVNFKIILSKKVLPHHFCPMFFITRNDVWCLQVLLVNLYIVQTAITSTNDKEFTVDKHIFLSLPADITQNARAHRHTRDWHAAIATVRFTRQRFPKMNLTGSLELEKTKSRTWVSSLCLLCQYLYNETCVALPKTERSLWKAETKSTCANYVGRKLNWMQK